MMNNIKNLAIVFVLSEVVLAISLLVAYEMHKL